MSSDGVPQVGLLLGEKSLWIGLGIRLFLAWLLPWLLDDGKILPGVAYTDIDYHVFTDAAAHIQQGGSPYDRHTYRYTPFLAALLALFPSRETGRYFFCVADTVVGWLILRFRRLERLQQPSDGKNKVLSAYLSPELVDALWWLYNPLAINICTRGSAESLVVLWPVLWTVWICKNNSSTRSLSSAALAGFWHGFAIHAKLYPVIYTLSFMTSFAWLGPPLHNPTLISVLSAWIRRLLQPAPLVFAVSCTVTFAILTYLSVVRYGSAALHEGLLYHFSRVDHRHNYSIHWYWIYLARASGGDMVIVSRLLLVPQLMLLLVSSLGLAPKNLCLALFVQTFLFVAHNKVITAQYFTWYLCLLPLCSTLRWTRSVGRAVLGLLLAVSLWLGSAYCLEMQGMAWHRIVWLASLLFFAANVNLLGAILSASSAPKKKKLA